MSNGSTPVNRETIRDALVAQATIALPAAAAVYGYMRSSWGTLSPVVRVVTAGSMRPQLDSNGIRSEFRFSIQLFVLYYELGTPEQQAEAEDTLDALEFELVSWLCAEETQVQELWTALRFDRPSEIRLVKVGGEFFLMEDVTVVAEVYG